MKNPRISRPGSADTVPRLAALSLVVLILAAGSAGAGEHTSVAGRWILSGVLSFSSSGGQAFRSEGDPRSTRLQGTPSCGVFVNDRLALGLMAHVDHQARAGDRQTSLSAGPYAVWHLKRPADDSAGAWIPTVGVSWMMGQSELREKARNDQTIGFHMFRGEAGVTYMLSDSLGLSLSGFRALYATRQDGVGVNGEEWGLEYGVTAYLF